MAAGIPKIIVGLGNPGREYAMNRHNIGYRIVDELAAEAGESFRGEPKVMGATCRLNVASTPVRLLKPDTYMNESGQSVRRAMDFYKLLPDDILVVHDELDLPPGTVRLKQGGGHGGHNGLRDVISHVGRDFLRLRIGIGHPGDKRRVTNYVLRKAPADEQRLIDDSLIDARRAIDTLFRDGLDKAMLELHTDQ